MSLDFSENAEFAATLAQERAILEWLDLQRKRQR